MKKKVVFKPFNGKTYELCVFYKNSFYFLFQIFITTNISNVVASIGLKIINSVTGFLHSATRFYTNTARSGHSNHHHQPRILFSLVKEELRINNFEEKNPLSSHIIHKISTVFKMYRCMTSNTDILKPHIK